MGLLFLFPLALGVLMIVSQWKIYEKAGQPGWACIVPIYNIIVYLKIIKKPIWWLIMMFIPLVNIVFMILMIHELSKAFGKGAGFTIGLILLPIIFIPLLGLGDATYQEPANEI